MAYAALVGWLYQDAGDLGAAAFWRGITQEIALRSRDPHLIGYSLVNQAQVRTDLGDGYGVVDLCEAALEDAGRLAPKVRVMAMQQQAHGAPLTADRSAGDRLIDQAAGFLARVDDDLPWGNACRRTPNYLEVQRALLQAARPRSRGRAPVGAGAGRCAGDRGPGPGRVPGQARDCRRNSWGTGAEGGDRQGVAQIAVDTGSVRMRRELKGLEQMMRSWHGASAGQDLAEVLWDDRIAVHPSERALPLPTANRGGHAQ